MSARTAWEIYMARAKERERRVVLTYPYCGSQRATARKLGLHPSTVCKIMKRIGERVEK